MNIVSYKRLIRFINANMAFTAFSSAMMVALNLLKPGTGYISLLPIFLVINAQFFMREYIKNFFVFLLGNILCFSAAFLFRDNLFVLAVYILFILLSVIVNFALRIKPSEDVRVKPLVVFYLAVPAICEILIFKVDLGFLKGGILISAIIYLMLYFASKYLLGYTDFLHEVRDAKLVPFSQIKRSTLIMLSGFFVIAFIVVAISTFIPFGDMVWAILTTIGHGILFLLRLIFRGENNEVTEPIADEAPSSMNPNMGLLAGDTSPSMFWVIMEKVIMYGTVILVASAIVIGIIYAIYNIIRKFNENTNSETDVVEFINPFDKVEGVKVVNAVRRSILDIIAPPNEAKIRKIFYKAANTASVSVGIGKTEENKDVKTPSELLPENEVLVGLYEKARYSGKPCSKEDVLAAKKSVDYK